MPRLRRKCVLIPWLSDIKSCHSATQSKSACGIDWRMRDGHHLWCGASCKSTWYPLWFLHFLISVKLNLVALPPRGGCSVCMWRSICAYWPGVCGMLRRSGGLVLKGRSSNLGGKFGGPADACQRGCEACARVMSTLACMQGWFERACRSRRSWRLGSCAAMWRTWRMKCIRSA